MFPPPFCPLSQAAEMAMPPLMKSVAGTSTVSMDAAQPSSTVAVRAQVEIKTVSEREACTRPPKRALTLSKQTLEI